MAWTAPATWLAGSTLTAAQLNEQVRDNLLAGGPIYATTAARDTAIPAPFAGQQAFVTADSITYQYSGTGWVPAANLGAWTTFTPALTGCTGTAAGRYIKMGRLVVFDVLLTITAVTGQITIALPFTAAAARMPCYQGTFTDIGSATYGTICIATTTVVSTYVINTAGAYGSATATGANIPFTWAANDLVELHGAYEAAA
jgi:hypothetical protein